ncbi:aminomethyl transferase family protein, partial [Mesorhizobium sp. M00.F.Ca.ET.149.01.1.1]
RSVDGVKMTVQNSTGEITCVAHSMPFFDAEKKRRTAKG